METPEHRLFSSTPQLRRTFGRSTGWESNDLTPSYPSRKEKTYDCHAFNTTASRASCLDCTQWGKSGTDGTDPNSSRQLATHLAREFLSLTGSPASRHHERRSREIATRAEWQQRIDIMKKPPRHRGQSRSRHLAAR